MKARDSVRRVQRRWAAYRGVRARATLRFTSVILQLCDCYAESAVINFTPLEGIRVAGKARETIIAPVSAAKRPFMDTLLAAVDLGSNSFRLSIGRVVQHDGAAQIYAIDRLKEHVRLAAGLGPDNELDDAAIERAVISLKRFGERIEGFHPNRVRAVATNTLRMASNAQEVLPRLEEALGFPIEIISGQEEARLIFTGISHELPPSPYRRLMIDIGGGSTEVIIGQEFRPLHMTSLFMGCVSYTRRFFPDGVITESR